MRISRVIAGALSAALLGLVPVALTSAPAHAADNATVTTLQVSRNLLEYKSGYSPFLSGSVKTADGSSVYAGNVSLQASEAGSAWKTIKTVTASGYLSFSDVIPNKNTAYRVVYAGGADSRNTYQASSSGTVTVKVMRKLTIKNPKGTKIKGKVAPKYAKKKIVIKKKVGKKWKKFRTLKTNKKSRFTVTLPAKRKRTYFRFIVPGNKAYAKNVSEGSTIRY